MAVKFPHIDVTLIGSNGNAFAILGTVTDVMKRHKVSQEDITAFQEEATSGDYNQLLNTCMKWFNVN